MLRAKLYKNQNFLRVPKRFPSRQKKTKKLWLFSQLREKKITRTSRILDLIVTNLKIISCCLHNFCFGPSANRFQLFKSNNNK